MKRSVPLIALLFLLAACSQLTDLTGVMQQNMTDKTANTTDRVVAPLPDLGEAPELTNTVWLNTPNEQPLRLSDLRGQVVLLDFWTFGCINCIHVMPALKDWHAKYSDQGLVIIGNHFPEFSYEHDINNVRAAVKKYDLLYPIAQDNDGTTWYAYGTRYWPTMILIDKRGHMRYTHIGEGRYAETEKAITLLLAETYP